MHTHTTHACAHTLHHKHILNYSILFTTNLWHPCFADTKCFKTLHIATICTHGSCCYTCTCWTGSYRHWPRSIPILFAVDSFFGLQFHASPKFFFKNSFNIRVVCALSWWTSFHFHASSKIIFSFFNDFLSSCFVKTSFFFLLHHCVENEQQTITTHSSSTQNKPGI